MVTWNKTAVRAFLLLICSVGIIALFPATSQLIDWLQGPTPEYILSVAGERQFSLTWYLHLLVSALASIAAIYFGVVSVRQAESEKSKGKWLGVLSVILSVFVLFTLIFSTTL